MAVDDSDRAAPAIKAARVSSPRSAAPPAIIRRLNSTCKPPSPKTRRRMVLRRSNDNSRPIKNSRKTMPSSAT